MIVEIAGHRIAGMGGTFESQVWLPGRPETGIQNYQDFLERLALKPQHVDIAATKKRHALSAQIHEIAQSLEQTAGEAREGIDQLGVSARKGLAQSDDALQAMQGLRDAAAARMKIVEQIMARLAGLRELAERIEVMLPEDAGSIHSS